MCWVKTATDVEIGQMKLIYAAVYMILGILPLDLKLQTREVVETIRDPEDDNNTEWVTPEALRPPQYLQFPNRKRFQPIEKLVIAGQKQLKGIETSRAREKFRWLCRENSDKFILRYIRQMGDSRKAVSAICETIAWHLTNIDGQEVLRKGEAHYVFEEPNERFLRQAEVGKRQIVGLDKMGRPINVLVARRNITKAQSALDLERFSLLMFEQTFLSLQDSVDGAIIIFDMQGFTAKNMDNKIAKFIIDKINKLYPMMVVQWYIYKAPRVFHAIYKMIKPLFDDAIVGKIKFIDDNEELLSMISADQLPASLGGNAKREYRWIPPKYEDDAPLRDDATRKRLERERHQLFKDLEEVNKRWITQEGPIELSVLDQERQFILEKIRLNYWTLDPYVRSRTIYDRNGMFGMLKPELAEGSIAQPVCKPEFTYGDLMHPSSPTQFSNTSSFMLSLMENANDRDTIPSSPSVYSMKGPRSPAGASIWSFSIPQTTGSVTPPARDIENGSEVGLNMRMASNTTTRKTVRLDAFQRGTTAH